MNDDTEKPIIDDKNKILGVLNGIFKFGLKKRSFNSNDPLVNKNKISKVSKISTIVLPRERPYSPSTDENSPISSKRFILSALKLNDIKDLDTKEKASKIIQNKWNKVAKKFRFERYVRIIISTFLKIRRNLILTNFSNFKSFYEKKLLKNKIDLERLKADRISYLKILKSIYSKYSLLNKKNKFERWKIIKYISIDKYKNKFLSLQNTFHRIQKKIIFSKLKKKNSKFNLAPILIKNYLQRKINSFIKKFFDKLVKFNESIKFKSRVLEKVTTSLNRKIRIIKISISFEKWNLLTRNKRIYHKISNIYKIFDNFTKILKKNIYPYVFYRLKEKRDKKKSIKKMKNIALSNIYKNLFTVFNKFKLKARPRRLVLQKIVNKHYEFTIKKLHINLIKWKNKSKTLTLKTSAKKIQRFFNYVKVKKTINNMKLNITKIDRGGNSLISSYKKMLLKFPFGKIKQEAKRRVMIKFLLFLRRKELKNFMYSLRRIQKYAKVKLIVLNAYAKRIQDKFRAIKQKTKIKNLKIRIKILKNIINSQVDSSNNRILSSYLNIWRSVSINVASGKIFVNSFKNSNSKVIQKFLRRKLDDKKQNLKVKSKANIKILFKDYFVLKKFKPYMKIFLLNERLSRAKIKLKQFFFRKFINKEYSYHYSKCFGNLNVIYSKILVRINKSSLERIKSYSEFIKLTQAANRIKFYYNKFIENKRNKKLIDMTHRLCHMNSQLLKFNLRKWLKISKEIKLLSCADIITKYIHDKWTSLKCSKKWKNYISLYRDKNKLIYVGRVLKFSKFCILMEDISNSYKNKNMIYAVEKIKLNSLNKLKINFLTSIYNHYHHRNQKLTKEYNFNLWKIITDKINKKEKSSILVNSLLSNSYKDYSKLIILFLFKMNIFRNILKKLFLKFSIKKIKHRADNKDILLSFCDSLMQFEMVYDKNSKIFARNRIMTLYIYKVLLNMNKILKNKNYELHRNFFLNQLNMNRVHKSYEFQTNSNYGDRPKQFKTLSFSQSIISAKKIYNELLTAKKVDKFLIAPYIFNFINKYKNDNLKSSYDKMKIIRKGSKMNEVITNLFMNHLPRKKLLDKIKHIHDYKLNTPILLNNLRILLRKFFIIKILKPYLDESAKIVKLMNLIWITLRNKKRADSKFLSIIIRKWIFDYKMNILAKKKLSGMYENIQNSFISNSEIFYPGDEYDLVYNQLRTTKKQTQIYYKNFK